MAATFRFEVYTPYRLFFADYVESVSMTLVDGEIEILAQHSAFTAPVETCVLRVITQKGERHYAFISTGILEVTEVKTVLMVDSADWSEEIDTERAVVSGNKARENLNNALLKFEVDYAKNELKRSEVRMKVVEMQKSLK